MKISGNLDFIIKYALEFFIVSNLLFLEYVYINVSQNKIIEIDNKFKTKLYENDISFKDYETTIKPIAFYHPEYINISYNKYFNKNEMPKQPGITVIEQVIEKQTRLAKNHGIYGFAIYFDLFDLNYCHNILNNFSSDKINFPFFLIWKNDEIKNITEEIIENLINNLEQYIKSNNYIKFGDKPVISISKPSKFSNIKNILRHIRKKAKKVIGRIFIFYPFTGNFTEKKFFTQFDAAYDFSKIDLIEHIIIKPNILYYSGIIYKNLILNKFNFNFSIYRTCNLNYKNFNDYNPEKFYIANNLIFNWININYEKNFGIVFVDSWNNYKNGNYLEPDEEYGYASINSFSKSLFNLPFQEYNFNLNMYPKIEIAVQIHVYYEEIVKELIDKLNLIPLKYNLFISTISESKKKSIEKYLLNSNANEYEIRIFPNIGRDVFPFVRQMKTKYKKYKYICHVHTKKSSHKSLLGFNWRNYIFSNLIGSEKIISEILYDFETNQKLGFIFPEIYYEIIKDVFGFDNVNFALNLPNKKYMNIILRRIFKKFKIGEKLDFPAGNMFWAKTKSIYQIFNVKLRYPKELNQTNGTIMHGIERIWLYIVKLNGYYYKAIFKHY